MIPLSVYLHWPWCIHKCPYCDFNSHEFKREKDSEDQYVKNLLLSVERLSHRGEGRQISTIYLGGGTPSLLSPSSISQILEGLHRNFVVAPMEANPGTFEYKNFAGYRKAGINRLSIGIQSFDDQKLKLLGRIHSSEEAKRAAGAAAEIFENFNLDLMFALPGQTFEELEKDISTALSFGSSLTPISVNMNPLICPMTISEQIWVTWLLNRWSKTDSSITKFPAMQSPDSNAVII